MTLRCVLLGYINLAGPRGEPTVYSKDESRRLLGMAFRASWLVLGTGTRDMQKISVRVKSEWPLMQRVRLTFSLV
jgi:hypothetical protein